MMNMDPYNFFTKDSKIVQNQIYLIDNGYIQREDVPPLYNLREVVYYVLDNRDLPSNESINSNLEGGV